MRVPFPIVIPLILAVVGGVWWSSTRDMDFMTPPSAAALEQLRAKRESALALLEPKAEAPPPPAAEPPAPPTVVVKPKPVVDLGDLKSPPTLHDYTKVAPQGADYLVELATQLEAKGEPKRALLAWERVTDLTKPDDSQSAAAISAIRRLRSALPVWNAKPALGIPIVIHASAGKSLAKTLTATLEGVARDLEQASSGVVKVTAVVAAGKTNSTAQSAVPVAIWLSGPDKKSTSTGVLSFGVNSPDSLRQDLFKSLFRITCAYLSRSTTFTPPADLANGESPQDALNFRVTRLCWSEFATSLNLPLKKKP